MSDVMHRSAPSLPFTSRISGRGGPLDGAAEMDMAESPGSDEVCHESVIATLAGHPCNLTLVTLDVLVTELYSLSH